MNKSATIFIAVLVVLVLAAGTFFMFAGNQTSTDSVPTSHTNAIRTYPGETTNSTETMAEPPRSYVVHQDGVLENYEDKRRVLFFYASWCPTCQPVDRELREEAILPADVMVIRVNYNDPDTDSAEEALAEKYGITYQHTFVIIDGQGNELDKWNGGDVDQIVARLQ